MAARSMPRPAAEAEDEAGSADTAEEGEEDEEEETEGVLLLLKRVLPLYELQLQHLLLRAESAGVGCAQGGERRCAGQG